MEKPDWQKYDLDKASEFSTFLFDQLLTMARYSLMFNAALGAAMGYLAKFAEVFDPATDAREKLAIIVIAVFVSMVAFVFNLGALRAHNNVWKHLREIRAFAMRAEFKARSESGIFNLIHSLGEGAQSPKSKTYYLTQIFYSVLAGGWIVFAGGLLYFGYLDL